MNIRKIISWAAVILWMAIIFNLSSQEADQSSQLSTGIAEIITDTIEKVVPNINLDIGKLNHIVRKNAHFAAYFILGILVLNAFRRSGSFGYKSIIAVLLICILYAVSDEVHQVFVPGRGAQVKDVVIDSAGAFTGVGVFMIIALYTGRKRKRRG